MQVNAQLLKKSIGNIGCLLCLLSLGVWAEETLSMEFLEYLAEFETAEGEWIDPQELELMAAAGDEATSQEVNDEN